MLKEKVGMTFSINLLVIQKQLNRNSWFDQNVLTLNIKKTKRLILFLKKNLSGP